jgi:hypothetical protein
LESQVALEGQRSVGVRNKEEVTGAGENTGELGDMWGLRSRFFDERSRRIEAESTKKLLDVLQDEIS